MSLKYARTISIQILKATLLLLFIGIHLLTVAVPEPEKSNNTSNALPLTGIKELYQKLHCGNMSFEAFLMAWNGYQQLKALNKLTVDSILTVVDFSKPSTSDRMFVINTNQWKIVLQTLVAHGRNSGDLYAQKFSNIVSSYQSSLGTYVTGATYQGKHGYSLTLNGMEKGINDRAYERAIVIHGADYVNDKYISQYGRIGRSFGCPAVSYEISKTIIDLIKNGSCMFLYHPEYEKLNGLAMIGVGNAMAHLAH
ncbi:MAG: murein L,D-transpeptidase catalytic domain family protein [Breznakibacter sp.]